MDERIQAVFVIAKKTDEGHGADFQIHKRRDQRQITTCAVNQ